MLRNTGPECTRELVEAVARQLATQSVRDSDFSVVSSSNPEDSFAILQGGENRRISMSTLATMLDSWLALDSIRDRITALENKGVLYGTTAYWNSRTGFIPQAGDIIVYSDYAEITVSGTSVKVPGIKIGSGNGYVQDLQFVGARETQLLTNHMADSVAHTTAAEKQFWSNKLNVNDLSEVVEETLIFNRN